MGNDDKLGVPIHTPQIVGKPIYIDVIQSGFNLIHYTERRRIHPHNGKIKRNGNQGFFPAFAGGRYGLGEAALIVSRGLARESTRVPRLFNPPEVVVIDLTPAG